MFFIVDYPHELILSLHKRNKFTQKTLNFGYKFTFLKQLRLFVLKIYIKSNNSYFLKSKVFNILNVDNVENFK